VFPPEGVWHVVKLACERPDLFGTSLSQWDCRELARQLQADGVIQVISPETIRRILSFQVEEVSCNKPNRRF
jgi:hypothetical protein